MSYIPKNCLTAYNTNSSLIVWMDDVAFQYIGYDYSCVLNLTYDIGVKVQGHKSSTI